MENNTSKILYGDRPRGTSSFEQSDEIDKDQDFNATHSPDENNITSTELNKEVLDKISIILFIDAYSKFLVLT